MTELLVEDIKPEVALADLGVKPELLTAEERHALDTTGFVLLPRFSDACWPKPFWTSYPTLAQNPLWSSRCHCTIRSCVSAVSINRSY